MKKNKTTNNAKKDKPHDPSMTKKNINVETKLKEVAEKSTKGKSGETKIAYGYDTTFDIPFIYAYADFEAYKSLSKALFSNPHPSEYPAHGFAAIGSGKGDVGNCVCLIWVNNEIPLEESLPTFVHEIVHLSQDIMSQAGADDRNGELQAYMVEREFVRVMREFFGRELIDYEGKAMKAMKDAVGGLFAAPSDTPVSPRKPVVAKAASADFQSGRRA